jgi:hypothetical protein
MSERPEGSDDPRVAVYRVVDETERSYLAAHGHYGSSPSQSGKYFALTLDGARAFANAPMNAGAFIIQTALPASIVSRGMIFYDPGPHGAGLSLFFPRQLLVDVDASMSPPVIWSGAEA